MPDQVLDYVSQLVNSGQITAEMGQQLYLQSYRDQQHPAAPPVGGGKGMPPAAGTGMPQTYAPSGPAAAAPGNSPASPMPGAAPPPAPTGGAPVAQATTGYQPMPQGTLPVWNKQLPGQWVQDERGNIAFVPAQGALAGQQVAAGTNYQAPSNIPQFFQGVMDASKTHTPSGARAQAPADAASTTELGASGQPVRGEYARRRPDRGGADLVVGLADAIKPVGSSKGKRVVSTNALAPPLREIFGEGEIDLDGLDDDHSALLMRLMEVGK